MKNLLNQSVLFSRLYGMHHASPTTNPIIATLRHTTTELFEFDRQIPMCADQSAEREDGLTQSVQSQAGRLRDGLLYTGVILVISLSLSPDAQALQLSPTTLNFQAVQGDPTPQSQIVTISQDSTDMVIWVSDEDAIWASLQPTMGMMAGSTQVLVTVNPAGLDTGPYTATVTITTGSGDSIQLPVTLAVISTTSSGPTQLSWDPSFSTDVLGYNLYVGTASGIYSYTIDVGMVISYTLMNLELGSTYYFVVTAYDSSGLESAPSNEVSENIY